MTSDGFGGDAWEIGDVYEPEHPEASDGVNVRVLAPTVGAITDVVALVGPDLEPHRCHIYIRDHLYRSTPPPRPSPALHWRP